jgi:Ca-activated chloride channel family protein
MKNETTKGIGIITRWLKPAVAVGKGTTYLVVSIMAPKQKANGSRMPVDVSFVIDRSGSMAGEPLELAKRGVMEAIQLLDDQDIFAVIGYDNHVTNIVSAQAARPENKCRAIDALARVMPGGSTDLFGGWQEGVDALRDGYLELVPVFPPKHWPRRSYKRTILLSDGMANVGVTRPDAISARVSRVREIGVTTSTLGLGAQVDDLLLAGMAEAGGGNYAFAASPQDLPGFFARELGEALQVCASGMTLKLTLPKGVRAELLDSYPVFREGKELTVVVGDIPAGMTLNLVFAITTRARQTTVFPETNLAAVWKSARGSAHETQVSVDSLMAMSQTDFDSMPTDPALHELVAEKISSSARRRALMLYHQGEGTLAREAISRARQYVAAAPNARTLNTEFDELFMLDEAAPDFAMQRRVHMSNAHRESRNRER